MAVHAPITGARRRASILDTVLAQFEASNAASPGLPLKLSRTNRAWIGDVIETLIAILDHAGGDRNLEPDELDQCAADRQHAVAWSQAA